jgi:predicted ATPase
MITKWGVENFKSIRKADLDLAPLTVITGVNCSGKSSFLQSIVMLVQAAKRGDTEIDLKGDQIDDLIDLGSFDRIYHRNSAESEMQDSDKIGINCIIPSKENEYMRLELGLSRGDKTRLRTQELILECKNKEDKDSCLLKYTRKEKDDMINLNSLFDIWQKVKSDNNYSNIEWTDRSGYIFDKYSFLPDSLFFLKDLSDDDIKNFLEFLSKFPQEKLENKEDAQNYMNNISHCWKLDIHIAERLFALVVLILGSSNYKSDYNPSLICGVPIPLSEIPYLKSIFDQYPYRKNYLKSNDIEFDIDLADWYLEISKIDKRIKNDLDFKSEIQKFDKELDKRIKEGDKTLSAELPGRLKCTRDHLYHYFNKKVKYLGPLRVDIHFSLIEEPKKDEGEDEQAFYNRKKEYNEKMTDIGVKGEKTLSVIDYLRRIEYKIDNYVSPKYFDDLDYKPVKEKEFSEALAESLVDFGIADDYKRRDLGNGEFEINLIINGQKYSLAQLGTGVTQILPVLVLCHAAPVGSTLIIQEPEQNCHPKWQSKLADLFIRTSLSGRQCLIETHSEYIIEKLRLRTVMLSDRISLHEQTNIYFVSKHNGISEFKDIKMNEYAVLDEWPDGFFDETQIIIDEIFDEAIKKKEAQEKNE